MVCEIDSFLIHCEDSSKWIGASKPIKPLHKISGTGCIYCCLENQIEKLQAQLAEKDKVIAEAEILINKLSFYTKRVCGENRLDLDLKREYLEKSKDWIEKYSKQKDEVK